MQCNLHPALLSLPLTTAPYHTDELDPISTLPITDAVDATNAPFITGTLAPSLTALVDGCTVQIIINNVDITTTTTTTSTQ